ncbi:hypothetical protein MA16_Dca022512 [Dendrobium catenatum]|uniref:Uncharacterized protein n=1 Tax=Dendrobium catenatum TaxID=906689 RepID=A0A2I0VTF6_9ASPA|nr:hypothetical protein MA16_Dca022512 [Dendrobium catenatum]
MLMDRKRLSTTEAWANYRKGLSVPVRHASDVFNGGSRALDMFNSPIKGFKEKPLVINAGCLLKKKIPISVHGKGKEIIKEDDFASPKDETSAAEIVEVIGDDCAEEGEIVGCDLVSMEASGCDDGVNLVMSQKDTDDVETCGEKKEIRSRDEGWKELARFPEEVEEGYKALKLFQEEPAAPSLFGKTAQHSVSEIIGNHGTKESSLARDDLQANFGEESGTFVAWLWVYISKELISKATHDLSDPESKVTTNHSGSLDRENRSRILANHVAQSVGPPKTKNGLLELPSTTSEYLRPPQVKIPKNGSSTVPSHRLPEPKAEQIAICLRSIIAEEHQLSPSSRDFAETRPP